MKYGLCVLNDGLLQGTHREFDHVLQILPLLGTGGRGGSGIHLTCRVGYCCMRSGLGLLVYLILVYSRVYHL